MNIENTRRYNLINLKAVARYLRISDNVLFGCYHKLLSDDLVLAGINERISTVRAQSGFQKANFVKEHIPSIKWIAFGRVLICMLIYLKNPTWFLKTGLNYGANEDWFLPDSKKTLAFLRYARGETPQNTGGLAPHPA